MISIERRGTALVLTVRVSPSASKTQVKGEHAGALKISVAAAPEKGRANKELLSFLSSAFGVRKSDVSIISGGTAREKRVAVEGIPAGEFKRRLEEMLGN